MAKKKHKKLKIILGIIGVIIVCLTAFVIWCRVNSNITSNSEYLEFWADSSDNSMKFDISCKTDESIAFAPYGLTLDNMPFAFSPDNCYVTQINNDYIISVYTDTKHPSTLTDNELRNKLIMPVSKESPITVTFVFIDKITKEEVKKSRILFIESPMYSDNLKMNEGRFAYFNR